MKRETLTAAFAILWLVAAAAHALDETPAVKVTALVKSTTSWNGKRVAYPQGEAEISGMVIEIAPAAQTGWHAHPVPSFAMVLQGTLEVTLEDGRQKRIGAGEALIEVVNTLHNGRNVGTGPLKIVVFYAGAVGQPLTVKP
ncbi:MAG TPA: cupin domain-containing protein [Burkholderiales bacterium]|nr:cupin domain-containing protein [Burkholderiales bacterium]